MQLWNQRRVISVDENGDPLPSRCCSLDDVYDARRVAESLGMPFYVLNLESDFEKSVVEPFVQSYLDGETPIPCVACNSRLKFASLDKLAVSLGLRQSGNRTLRACRIRRKGESLSLVSRAKSLERSKLFFVGINAGPAFSRLFSSGRNAEIGSA
jgi:tRNA U34 2-thiouridine synthase MnmA/TrmU